MQADKLYKDWWQLLLVAVATLLVYSNVFHAGFMSWDDPEYVLNNPDITGLSSKHISAWFSSFYIGNYHPLTTASYAIDYAIGGRGPFVYHLTNILLHAANAALVYLLSRKLTGKWQPALFIALLFALHPVQTESVSWVAERKNVLSGFFYLLALYAYVGHNQTPSKAKLVLVLLAGVAAMLSKATAVTLPVALLAVDIWTGRRFADKQAWLEKLPLFIVSLAFGFIAIKAQQAGKFLNAREDYDLLSTIVFAGYAYVQYIVQLLLPLKLSVLYPYPPIVEAIHILFMLLAIAVVLLGIVAYRRGWYVLAGGLLFFTVNIAPVLQFVPFGEVLMADRYLYIACLGVWVPAGWYLFQWAGRNQQILAAMAISVISLGLYTLDTYTRNDIWLSEQAFWESVVETFPNSSVAQNSVGGVYLKAGDYRRALPYIDEAISLDPQNSKAWYNKGVLLLRAGHAQDALPALNKAIAIRENPKARFTRALIYQQMNEPALALADAEKVLQEEPANARAYFIKGSSLAQLNNLPNAIVNYTKAIELDAEEPLYLIRRGIAYATTNQNGAALEDLSNAIRLRPGDGATWYWRGMVKQQIGVSPCEDLSQSAKLGFKEAPAALDKICNRR